MKEKTDYSSFYISMIIILSGMVILMTIMDVRGEIEFVEHLEKDLEFMKETGEFLVFEAEIIGYCANRSNLTSNELLTNFLEYKSDEIIADFANVSGDEQ